MRQQTDLRLIFSSLALALLLGTTFGVQRVAAQADQRPDSAPAQVPDDPIRELNLTAEQRQQIRAIRQENQEERASINRRLREANRTLQDALDVDNPDEANIEPLLREVGMLQAAQMRMRVLSELRIRRVLTAEQRTLLRELRGSRQLRREVPRQERRELRRFPNQRNGLRQALPRPRP